MFCRARGGTIQASASRYPRPHCQAPSMTDTPRRLSAALLTLICCSTLYCDPLLVPVRNWKDTYQYDSSERISGWTRTAPGEQPRQFTAAGELVSESGETATAPRSVHYRLHEAPDKRSVLLWEPR
ncbi:MAG: hypothetical protein ACKOEO_20935, partial [Planctomycetaceae bacterium]